MKKINVAILGSQGTVGKALLIGLEENKFPINDLFLYDIVDIGKEVAWNGRKSVVKEFNEEDFANIDVVFVAVKNEISLQLTPKMVAKGTLVIDNSSAYRMDPDVPLVIPEVNAEDLDNHHGIIANPNCATTIALVPLGALNKVVPISRIIASTYQAVSGGGDPGMNELSTQTQSILNGEPFEKKVFQHQIAFNIIPHIDVFWENGYTKEEMKLAQESAKILHSPDIKVSCTSVRIPVYRSHSESLTVEFSENMDATKAKEILEKAPGVTVVDNPEQLEYPMPIDATDQDSILVGRIRDDISKENSINIWVSGDQIRKGAATNAIQIGLALIERGLIK